MNKSSHCFNFFCLYFFLVEVHRTEGIRKTGPTVVVEHEFVEFIPVFHTVLGLLETEAGSGPDFLDGSDLVEGEMFGDGIENGLAEKVSLVTEKMGNGVAGLRDGMNGSQSGDGRRLLLARNDDDCIGREVVLTTGVFSDFVVRENDFHGYVGLRNER